MPDLIDKAQRAVDRPPLARLHEPRCLVARDADARCTACADACPVGALAVRRPMEGGAQPYESVTPTGEAGPRIDDEACVRCGACITACPTNALLPLPPLDDGALLAQVEAAGTAARERASTGAAVAAACAAGISAPSPLAPPRASAPAMPVSAPGDAGNEAAAPEPATAGFACERVAQALRLDGERIVVLPCLAWVDTPLLVHLASSGAARVVTPLDACPSCELADVAKRVRAALASTRSICAVAGLDAVIETADGPGLRGVEAAPDADAAGEVSRRNLFAQAGASLLDTARTQAAKRLESLAGAPAPTDAPIEPDTRRWSMLDDLHAAGLADRDAVVPRALAPRVDIDVEHCSGCAQCALFCPTEALHKAGRLPGGRTLLEFDPSRCRDCGVCEATCRYGALVRDESLTAPELFALAPREITIPKRRVLPERKKRP